MLRRPLHTLLAALLLLTAAAATGAEPPRRPGSGDDLARQMQQLRQGLAEQEAMAGKARQREQALLAELAELEREMAGRQQELQELAELLEQKRWQTGRQQEESDLARQSINQAEEALRQRLAAIYQLGPTGLLNLLFAAESLPELLEFQHNLNYLIEHDRRSFAQYRQQLAALEQAGQTLSREQDELQGVIEAVQHQETELQAAQAQRAALLRQVQQEAELYRQARREITAAAEKLQLALARLQTDNGGRPAAGGVQAAGFAAQQGRLLPPAPGPITGRFDREGGRPGITIETAPNAEIRALFHGTVAFAGTMDNHGKLVLIEHDNNYFSLVAGLGELLTGPGATVRTGEIIGRMEERPVSARSGPTGYPHLYLEIRQGLKPQDPLSWLRAP